MKFQLAGQFFANDPVALAGKDAIKSVASSGKFDPGSKPLLVGGNVKLDSDSGVMLAQGGESHGWSLYLFDRIPHFSLRVDGSSETIFGSDEISSDWHHVAAAVNAKGEGQLYVDGQAVGSPAKVGLVEKTPQ